MTLACGHLRPALGGVCAVRLLQGGGAGRRRGRRCACPVSRSVSWRLAHAATPRRARCRTRAFARGGAAAASGLVAVLRASAAARRDSSVSTSLPPATATHRPRYLSALRRSHSISAAPPGCAGCRRSIVGIASTVWSLLSRGCSFRPRRPSAGCARPGSFRPPAAVGLSSGARRLASRQASSADTPGLASARRRAAAPLLLEAGSRGAARCPRSAAGRRVRLPVSPAFARVRRRRALVAHLRDLVQSYADQPLGRYYRPALALDDEGQLFVLPRSVARPLHSCWRLAHAVTPRPCSGFLRRRRGLRVGRTAPEVRLAWTVMRDSARCVRPPVGTASACSIIAPSVPLPWSVFCWRRVCEAPCPAGTLPFGVAVLPPRRCARRSADPDRLVGVLSGFGRVSASITGPIATRWLGVGSVTGIAGWRPGPTVATAVSSWRACG